MMPPPWWKRLPGRILEEEQALASLKTGEVPLVRTHRWIREAEGEPRIRVTLAVGAGDFEIEVRFPWHYPEGCPSVRPIPYDRPVSSHQFIRSGVFCLELGPDNWHPRYTAADMVRSAWRLLMQEIIASVEPFVIQSRHVSDLAEHVRLGGGALVRSSAFDECVRAAHALTEFHIVWPTRNLAQVFPVAFPKGTRLPDVMPALGRESECTALFVPLVEDAPAGAPEDPQGFKDFVFKFGGASLEHDASPIAVVLKWADGTSRGFLRLSKTVLHLVDVPLAAAAAGRTPEQLESRLSSLKIGIVGLGSLGSKIAVSLARTGVRRFVLVDGDLFLGENACRHAGSLLDVGAMKVDVVKELIRDVSATEPDIVRHPINLGSPTNPDLHASLMKDLGDADLLIDATANPDVFGVIAMLASDRQRPLVWAEVFAGGIGGLIGSAHPEDGPCPRCIRAGFAAYTQSWPPAPMATSDHAYGGGEDAPMVATDADVSLIAAAATNRALDLITPQTETLPSVVLVGLRPGWIFDAPFQSTPVHVRADDWSCPRCWKPASEADAETAARADSLFSLNDDAHDSPAA